MYGLFVVGSFADSLEIFDVWSGSYDEGSSVPKVSYDTGFCCRIEMAFCRPRLLGARKEYAMGFSDMGEYLRIYSRISFDSAIYKVFINTKSQVGTRGRLLEGPISAPRKIRPRYLSDQSC